MTKQTINISGYSDDVVSVWGTEYQQGEEYAAFDRRVYFSLLLPESEEGIIVTAEYLRSNWHIGISAFDEDYPLSNEWAFDIQPSYEGYKNLLSITAPKAATLIKMDVVP